MLSWKPVKKILGKINTQRCSVTLMNLSHLHRKILQLQLHETRTIKTNKIIIVLVTGV
jgi:hypothetical protein